jgi:hypothetical protein
MSSINSAASAGTTLPATSSALRAQGQLRLDAGQGHGQVEGFDQIIVGAQLQGLDDELLLVFGGDHDHRQAEGRMALANAPQHLQAVHFRHADVQQHQIEVLLREARQGLGAVFHGTDLIAVALQLQGHEVAIHFHVVHHQQVTRRRGAARACLRGGGHGIKGWCTV